MWGLVCIFTHYSRINTNKMLKKFENTDFPFRMTDIYEKMGLSHSQYSRWVKSNLLDGRAKEKIDYCLLDTMSRNKVQGRQQQEYGLTKRQAEKLAVLSRTEKGDKILTWLLDLKDKVEAGEYIKVDEMYFVADMVHFFSYITHQKAAEAEHLKTFIAKTLKPNEQIDGKIYAKFHSLRNDALDMNPKQLKERVQAYFEKENRMITKEKKRDILFVLNKYGLVGNAAYDYMSSMGKPSDVAIKVGGMVEKMASILKIEILPVNEDNLFHKKQELNPALENKINPKKDIQLE